MIYTPTMQDSWPNIVEDDIRTFEREIHSTLPVDYRAFLLRSNGGCFARDVVYVAPSGAINYDACIRMLFPLLPVARNVLGALDLRRARSTVQVESMSHVLIIGDNSMGNFVCLNLGQSNAGEILSMNHNNNDAEFVADSFVSFRNGLRYDPMDNLPREQLQIFQAVEMGDMELLQRILHEDAQQFDQRNEQSQSLLTCAICARQPHIVAYLLRNGCNVADSDSANAVPLHVAVKAESLDCSRLLIAAGASLETLDGQGRTPLMVAIQNDFRRIVELLVTMGANVNALSDSGETPLDYCAKMNSYSAQFIRPFLVKAGAIER